MFLSKHSNGFYYLWFKNSKNKKQKVSTRCKRKSDALKYFQSFKQEEYARKLRAKQKLLSELSDDFLTYAASVYSSGTTYLYKLTVHKFISIVGDLPLTSYTPQHFDIFKSVRYKKVKPVTINIELRILRAFFNTALRWQILDKSPYDTKLLQIPQAQPSFLTKQDFQKIIDMIKENWLKEVIIFAVSTGLRRGEIINLRWCNIDLQRKLLIIESNPTFRTKTGRRRILPMNDTTVMLLQSKYAKRTTDYVFTYRGRIINGNLLTHAFKRLVQGAKLNNQNIHFHSLRHTFASWLAQDGTSVYVIKDFLGHQDVKTTQIYSHLCPESLHSEINKISISLN